MSNFIKFAEYLFWEYFGKLADRVAKHGKDSDDRLAVGVDSSCFRVGLTTLVNLFKKISDEASPVVDLPCDSPEIPKKKWSTACFPLLRSPVGANTQQSIESCYEELQFFRCTRYRRRVPWSLLQCLSGSGAGLGETENPNLNIKFPYWVIR